MGKGRPKKLKKRLRKATDTATLADGERVRLSRHPVRVPLAADPFRLEIGDESLILAHDSPLRPGAEARGRELRLFNPARREGISFELGVSSGHAIALARHRQLFAGPRSAAGHDVQLAHEGDTLAFAAFGADAEVFLSQAPGAAGALRARRDNALEHLRDIVGPAFGEPGRHALCEILATLNERLTRQPFRSPTRAGLPGALVELPPAVTPILVGDLHGQLENILTLLTRNGFLEQLDRGAAALIFLGDVVHEEAEERLAEMGPSALLMDVVHRLMLRYPDRVFFVLGNHDGFSPELSKRGVQQGLLWSDYLAATRGRRYRQLLERFYTLSPLMVTSHDFVACHAAPPRTGASREQLIEAAGSAVLSHDLTSGRRRTPVSPAGYVAAHVKRLRRALSLPKHAPFITGHYPVDDGGPVWRDVGGIKGDHVIMSCQPDRVAVFTRVDAEIVPLVYPVETVSSMLRG